MNHLLSFALLLAQGDVPAPGPPPEEPSTFNPAFIITMLVIFVGFYVLIALPQRKEQERKQAAVEGMKKGDKVVSIGGIHGTVVRVDKEAKTAVVQVAKGVELVFNLSAVNAAPKAVEEKSSKVDMKKSEKK